MKENKGFLLRTSKQMNKGAVVSGVGFGLYIAASALGQTLAADAVAVVFGIVALYVLASVAAGRRKDKEAVSYSLLWGQGAVTLLLVSCALLAIRQRLGL